MEPIPYRIREEDVDEVLDAYQPSGGGEWTDDARVNARAHVMRNVLEIDDVVRTLPEDARPLTDTVARTHAAGDDSSAGNEARREVALAVIEDLLIRDGFLRAGPGEERVFPV